MEYRKWPTALTKEEMRERLGIACCALDKLAQWTQEDTKRFGNPHTFAEVTIKKVMAPSKQTS